MIGTTLAHYKILEKIGAGGMGEVYRAADSKLGRDVAMKVLPEALARDPERMARFQREAQLLAQLNHPHIAAIYGLESAGGVTALVLELIEGPTLAERIKEGALPVDEMIPVAKQIAEAIETAHERGIIHRDLKPANVKFTHDGNVKVLDFGLARAFDADPQSQSGAGASGATLDSPTLSPALTSPVITGALTGVNVILGTAAYMSPEQARGKPVDKRSDIWSFGVVCFEMLTGRRLFEGETVSDTLAAVLKTDPDWDGLPDDTPEPLRRLLRRCLERDPRKRLRDIGEARVRLELWSADPSSLTEAAPSGAAGGAAAAAADGAAAAPARASKLPWIVAAAAVLAAAGFALFGNPEPAPAPKLRLDIQLPNQAELLANSGVNIQFSPDGRLLAYRTREGLRIRPLDQRESTLLPDTDRALQFTFSPDSKWIAFITDGTMYRISVDGGTPIEICDAELVARGLAWINPRTIVFTPNFAGGIRTIDLETGEIRELTTLDDAAEERTHRWPTALPDGKSVLFLCQYMGRDYDEGDIRMITVGEDSATTVYRGGAAPRWSPSGHLLFVKDKTVFAVPLDLKKRATHGLPVPVLGGVWASVNDQESDDGSAQYDISPQGMLVYRSDPAGMRSTIMAADVAAAATARIGEPGEIKNVRVSPDGRVLASLRSDGGRDEIHLEDLSDGGSTRFTFDEGILRLGCWSPDSRVLYWAQSASGAARILARPVDGSTPPRMILENVGGGIIPTAVSPDGKQLLCSRWLNAQAANVWDLVVVDLTGEDREPRVLVEGPGIQSQGSFSPDGRWISYLSSDGQSFGIYLRRFPDTGAQWRITGGNTFYLHDWLADGTGILIHDDRGTVRIPIELGTDSPRIGQPVPLLPEGLVPPGTVQGQGSFAADGTKLFYIVPDRPEDQDDRVVLVTGWVEELRGLAD